MLGRIPRHRYPLVRRFQRTGLAGSKNHEFERQIRGGPIFKTVSLGRCDLSLSRVTAHIRIDVGALTSRQKVSESLNEY